MLANDTTSQPSSISMFKLSRHLQLLIEALQRYTLHYVLPV